MTAKKKEVSKNPLLNTNLILLVGGALVLGIGLGVGSFLIYDRLSAPEKQIEVAQQNLNTTITNDEQPLPQNFPSDFPVYPGSELKSSWVSQGEVKEGISVLWESSDSVLKVSDYYNDRLISSGWIVTSSFENEGSYTISFEKGTTAGFIGIAKSDSSQTQISATLGIEKLGL